MWIRAKGGISSNKIIAVDDIFTDDLYKKIKVGELEGKNPAQIVADEVRALQKNNVL